MRQLQEHSWMPLSPRQTRVRDLYMPSLNQQRLGCCSRCLSLLLCHRELQNHSWTSTPLLPRTDLQVCGSGNTDGGGVIAALSSDTSMLESCDAVCCKSCNTWRVQVHPQGPPAVFRERIEQNSKVWPWGWGVGNPIIISHSRQDSYIF